MKQQFHERVSRNENPASPPVCLPSCSRNPKALLVLGLFAVAAFPLRLAAQQPNSYDPNGQYPAQGQAYGDGSQNLQQQPGSQPQYAEPQYSQPQYPQPENPQQPALPQQPYADQAGPPDLSAPQAAPAQQPLSAVDLEQLLAPVALYPDNLLAQILAASTYPEQVAAADSWLHQMQQQGYGSADQIAAGAQAENGWDPSVKALTAFPQVLDMMNQNLQWTTSLGNAYYNQPQDVMQTVQVLRERAQQAGNLQTTPQEDVNDDQGYIEVAPANPEVVYVPAYNPWYAYGPEIAPYPGFSVLGAFGSYFGGAFVRFGPGIALAAFDRFPFGWFGWGLNWFGHGVFFNHGLWCTHSASVADWGFPHGGQRVFGARGFAGNGYRGAQPYNRFGGGYNQSRNDLNVRPAFHQLNGTNQGYGFGRGNGFTNPGAPGRQNFRPMPAPVSRPQSFGGRPQSYQNGEGYARPGYGNFVRPAQTFGNRPGFNTRSPYQNYRSPSYQSPSYRQPSYSQPAVRQPQYREPAFNSSHSFAGRSAQPYGNFARNEGSGFHPFSRGSAPGGFREPKSFHGGGFGGGRAPRSSGHFSAPRESHSGGGRGRR